MNNKVSKIIAIVLFAITTVIFGYILFSTGSAVKSTAEDYLMLKDKALSEEVVSYITYDDNILAQLRFGNSDSSMQMTDYLQNSLKSIDSRIAATGIVYVLIVTAILSYALYVFFGKNRNAHLLTIFGTTVFCYAIYVGMAIVTAKLAGMPFYFMEAKELLLTVIGLLSIMAYNAIIAVIFGKLKYKALAILPVIAAAYFLHVGSFIAEYGLYTDVHSVSFANIAMIDDSFLQEDFDGEFLYDQERNIVVYNGTEYVPDEVENMDHFFGAERAAAIVFEIVSPASAVDLALANQFEADNISAFVCALYLLKSLVILGAAKKAR